MKPQHHYKSSEAVTHTLQENLESGHSCSYLWVIQYLIGWVKSLKFWKHEAQLCSSGCFYWGHEHDKSHWTVRCRGLDTLCLLRVWLALIDRRRKWTRQHEFKSWMRLISFYIALIPLGKVWIQLFSLQLWVNSWADWVLQPWWGN